jgi:hypothetical protein
MQYPGKKRGWKKQGTSTVMDRRALGSKEKAPGVIFPV